MKNLQHFWKNFLIGFLDCYNVIAVTTRRKSLNNIKTTWLKITGYVKEAYKNKVL